jgi:hypothetical protein
MNINAAFTLIAVLLVGLAAPPARAGVKGEVIREGAEYVMRKFGKEVTQELGQGAEQVLARKMESMATRFGERETMAAVERVGPRAFRLVEEAGKEAAPQAVKLMARVGDDAAWVIGRKRSLSLFTRYGDDAADAMLKHREIAEGLIEQFGPPSARALKALDGRGARRLAMMADEGQLAALPERAALMETIGKHGTGAMDWVWRNKGALATAGVVAAFVHNPQPFIDGTVKVADIAGEKVVKPVLGTVAGGVASRTNWTIVLVSLIGVSAAYAAWRGRRRMTVGR